MARTGGRRIIFIHGIGGKPRKERYLRQWTSALQEGLSFPLPPSVTRLSYWSDLRRPVVQAEARSVVRELSSVQRHLIARLSEYRTDLSLWDRIVSLFRQPAIDVADPLIRFFLDRLVEDVSLYFYDAEAREQIQSRLLSELHDARGHRVALISHSMGTVIALDVLQEWPDPIDLFVTIGSPLGLSWIQRQLGAPGYPNCVRVWQNVYDREDLVTLPDQDIANDFPHEPPLQDHLVPDVYSDKGVRDPHHWHGYLGSRAVSQAVKEFWKGLGGR